MKIEIIKSINTFPEWDKYCYESSDHNIYQSTTWALIKINQGWSLLRFIIRDGNNKTIFMAQCLYKKIIAGIYFVWTPGGPLLNFPNSNKFYDQCLEKFTDQLKKQFPFSMVRIYLQISNNDRLKFSISKFFKESIFRINSCYTIKFEDILDEEKLLKGSTKKHRYYIQKSKKNKINWKFGKSDNLVKDFLKMHNEMVEKKEIKSISITKRYFEDLKNYKNKNTDFLIIIGIRDNVPLSGCVVLKYFNKSYYVSASSSQKGRDLSSSYSMIPILFKRLKLWNIEEFDFSGIDPFSKKAYGVNHFKLGFNGKIINHVGEWDYSRNNFIRLMLNLAIRIKIKST